MKAIPKKLCLIVAMSLIVQLLAVAMPHHVQQAEAAEPNLVLNGDFETTSTTSNANWVNGVQANNWGVWRASGGGLVSVADAIYHSGAKSLEVKHPSAARTGLSQDVTVVQVPAGGKSYKLGAWFKTENVVSSLGVFLRTQFYEELNGKDGFTRNLKIADGPSLQRMTGTSDWTYREVILQVPERTRYIRLEPFFETGTGTAWFDHITLEEWRGMTGLSIDPAMSKLDLGETLALTAHITPQNATDQTLVWSSSNPDVASVSQGIVTAHAYGVATVRAASVDGLIKAESTIIVESAEMQAGYGELRTKWRDKLLGGQGIDANDPDIAAAIEKLNKEILNSEQTGSWDLYNGEPDPEALFEGIITKTNTSSAKITQAYSMLAKMAAAYKNPLSDFYGNAELLDDVLAGLSWLHIYQYNASKPITDNWWDWEIGTPQALSNILVLLYDEMTPQQSSAYVSVIDRFVPDPLKRVQNVNVVETGANLFDKALVVTLSGLLSENSAKIEFAKSSIMGEFDYTTSGDGIYEDGSLVQHYNIAYTGAYGSVLLGRIADLFYLYEDSPWEMTDPRANNVYDWVENVFEPLMYKGAMMDAVRGRSIARSSDSDHLTGRGIIRTIAKLSEGAPGACAAKMKSMIKQLVQSDTTFSNYYQGLTLADIHLLKSIVNDPEVTPRGTLVKHKQFSAMDRTVHLRDTFGFAVSMFSDRISAFEYGNGENRKGWYTGIGMTSLYNEDLTQYSDQYWPTVDSFRLPGTTTDGYAPEPVAWKYYYNEHDWVGGSSIDGLYGSSGMDFSLGLSTGSGLQGKKSWFMFDDEIVALGSGITSPDAREVETIVENRKIKDSGDNEFIVNGKKLSAQLGWEEYLHGVEWAHLEGNAQGSDIGYYFPQPSEIYALKEARTGSWQDINSGGSSNPITKNYLSLAFQHGTAPLNASYAYVLLPGQSAKTTKQYSSNPNIEIISQTNEVHAVKEKMLGISSFNFWEGSTAGFVRTDKPASVQVREQGSELIVAVSDPTWKGGKIVVDIAKTAVRKIEADSSVTVLQMNPYLKLEVDTTGTMGRSQVIRLEYDPVQSPQLEAAGITLNDKKVSVAIGESVSLEATLAPIGATGDKLIWSVDRDDVVEIVASAGNTVALRGKRVGTAVVTVSSEDGTVTASARIHVLPAAAEIPTK